MVELLVSKAIRDRRRVTRAKQTSQEWRDRVDLTPEDLTVRQAVDPDYRYIGIDTTLRVPIMPSVLVSGMFVFVDESAESVVSMDTEQCEGLRVGGRFGQRCAWSGVRDASVGPVLVVVAFVLAQGVQQMCLVEGQGPGSNFRQISPGPGPVHHERRECTD